MKTYLSAGGRSKMQTFLYIPPSKTFIRISCQQSYFKEKYMLIIIIADRRKRMILVFFTSPITANIKSLIPVRN